MRSWVGALALVMTASFHTPSEAEDLAVRFIGQQIVPTGARLEGTVVGGLSGIDYDAVTGRYVAISDDRSRHGPARFYDIALALNSRRFDGVSLTGVRFMGQPGGGAYHANAIDAESIRFAGADLIYASEGSARAGIAPFVREMAADGRYLRSFDVPRHFMPGRRSGVRDNRAFESLTVSSDGARILAATEASLAQDNMEGTRQSRILSFDRATGEPVAEYVYEIEDGADRSSTGLAELLALDGTRYLALERSTPSRSHGGSARIFLVDLGGATNVAGEDALTGNYRPAAKSLLLDLDTLGIRLDNIEGMTFGPVLENGRRSLILVSDNNFSKAQVTQFLAFDIGLAREDDAVRLASALDR